MSNEPRLPEGNYRARAVSAEFGYTSKGNEQVMVQFDLLDPDYDGQKISWFGYFTEKTSERTMQALRFCGWKGDDVTNLEGLTDNEVELVIEHDTYEGKTRSKVQWVNRIGGGAVTMKAPMEEAKRKAFATKMKGLAVKTRKETATSAKPQIDPNDDVGF